MEHGEHREEILIDDHPHAFDTTEPKAGFIAAFGVATVITLVVTVLGIQFYFDQSKEQEVYQQVLKPVGDDLNNLRMKEDWQLSRYTYIDKGKGVVRLPIEKAMALYQQEAAAGKFAYPTNNSPIKPDVPPGAPGAATPAAPAASPAATPAAPANTNAPSPAH